MNKKINLFKNIAIMALVALCIMQTIQLWFDGFSSRNFIASFFSRDSESSATETLGSLVRPFRIVLPKDDGFTLLYGDEERANLRAQGDAALSLLMRRGEFSASYALDVPALLKMGGMLYEYAVPVPSEAYGRFFQARAGFLTNRFRTFDRIVFIPQTGQDNEIHIVFADSATQTCHEYVVRQAELGADLRTALAAQPSADVIYRATALDEERRFAENMFYAEWGAGGLPYSRLQTYSPYGEITIGNIERFVLSFFEVPGDVMWDVDDSVFTYRDANAIVKYYPNNVLEFSNYRAYRGTATNSFATAYAAAVNVLQRDKGVLNEYYLSSYAQVGESWFFTFDYTVNGYPVFISQNLAQSLAQTQLQNQDARAEMSNMIEIEVQHDRVRKYKRYGLAFEVDSMSSAVKRTGFWQTIENALEGHAAAEGSSALPIRAAAFGYRADGTPQLSLQWLIYDESGMPLPSFD